jgi:hypothetical protein
MDANTGTINTPVVSIIFNRPDTTRQVLNKIKLAKPPVLFVIADGPRDTVPSDKKKCSETRLLFEDETIDFPVIKVYSEKNLGCAERVITGLHYVFQNVGKAIILEDDCVPDLSFFRYCDELLFKYENDERVMTISGGNFQFGRKRTDFSYYFSMYPHIWGWATWKRAWNNYDKGIHLWPQIKKSRLFKDLFPNIVSSFYWNRIFDQVYAGKIATWDYQWAFSSWMNNSLAIIPNVNLVSNIGFGTDATLSKRKDKYFKIPAEQMNFPLMHPPFMVRNVQADRFTERTQFGGMPRMCIQKLGSIGEKITR